MAEIQQLMAAGMPALLALNVGQSQGGSGSAYFGDQGNLSVQFAAAPGTGANPASTAGDYVMAVFTLPSLTFDVAGRGVLIEAYGSTVNNANTKTFKIIVGPTTAVVGSVISGGTTIASAAVTTVAGGSYLAAQIFKYGITGSNTQLATHFSGQVGATATALVVPTALTLAENAANMVAVTINAATTATDAAFFQMIINMMN